MKTLPENTKWITNYEGSYAITTNGVVWSYKQDPPLEMKLSTQAYDYKVITLFTNFRKNKTSPDGKLYNQTYLVHRLVINEFGPPCPEPTSEYVVSHIDRNKDNNHISNLKWIKKSEVKTKNPTPVRAVGIDDDDVIYFRTLTDCSRYFRSNQILIRRAINSKNPYKGYTFYEVPVPNKYYYKK